MGRALRNIATAAVVAAGMAAVPQPAAASLVVVGSRAAFDALGPTVSIDWGVYGPAGTSISTPEFETVDGLTFHGASSEGVLDRHDEGLDYTGDFTAGDHLLTESGSLSDTFIVGFDSTAVRGFGMEIEPYRASGPWTGAIDVFSPADVLLGSIAISGDKTGAEDGSAPFYGIVSSSADIGFAYFWIDQSDPALPSRAGDVAINTMDVLVPEPASVALFCSALLLGLAGLRLRPRKASARPNCGDTIPI